MRSWIYLLLSQLLISSPAHAQSWTWTSKAEVDATAWKNSLGDSALQVATIVDVAATSRDWRFGISSGYVWAQARSDLPEFRGSVSTPLDTVVSGSFRGARTELAGRDLQISLDADVSLPTGKSRLRGRERNVVFDPLLARYDRYGEGLNYSAGVSAALSIVDELSLAVGVRFTGTGKYRPDGDSPAIEINPGDTPALSAHVVWRRGQDVLSFGAEVADERVARRNGIALLDRGRTVELSLTGAVTPAAGWTMTGAAFYTKREKDRRLDEVTGKFELEQSRLHGDIWAVAIAAYRQVSRRTAIGVEGDFALAGDSELDDADFSYLPARRRWRLGIGLKHQLGNRVNLKAVGRYVDYRDQGSRLLIPLDASGVNFTLGVSTSF